jgi:hypothetical protein
VVVVVVVMCIRRKMFRERVATLCMVGRWIESLHRCRSQRPNCVTWNVVDPKSEREAH